MKKATWLFSSVIAALLATGAPAVVSAAGTEANNLSSTTGDGFALGETDQSVDAESIAQLNIEGEALVLKAVPNLNFGQKTVKEFIDGNNSFDLVADSVNNGEKGYDGNSAKLIQVEDYRGTNAGWVLKAQLGEFDTGGNIKVNSLTLSGDPKGDNFSGELSTDSIAGSGANLLNAPAGDGTGSTTVTLKTAKLTLDSNEAPLAGTYQATVTWTLGAEPAADAPGA